MKTKKRLPRSDGSHNGYRPGRGDSACVCLFPPREDVSSGTGLRGSARRDSAPTAAAVGADARNWKRRTKTLVANGPFTDGR